MDIPVTSAYLSGMFSRLVTMLAVLVIAFMTTATSAHAARLSAGPDHAAHVSEMTQVATGSDRSCDGAQHCGSMDAGSCEVLCSGLSGECQELCVSERAHAVFRYVQASKRPANIMAS